MEMTNDNNSTDGHARKRIAALHATITALQEVLTFKNAHIVMLEERLLNMSVELASSRQSAQVSQDSTISEDDDLMILADLVDDSIKSAPAQTSSSSDHHPRFSFLPGWGSNRMSEAEDDFNDSARSLGSTGVGSIIGNMIKLDKSDRSQNLSVDFPKGGRRSMMVDEYSESTVNSPAQQQHQRRTIALGQFFRPRISSLTLDDAVEEICEQEEQQETTLHRKPNPKLLRHQVSSRLIGSTVLFPREDDDYSLGFE
mmetsp:Transcript_13568/g.21162  ORF Transcript_13568/g.21162 Transcript_13568/m.21162 type:complete len:256 (+) Transcript_13568:60-827(+)